MELTCIRCNEQFDNGEFRGYCDSCLGFFSDQREYVHQRQNPAPGVHACGTFIKEGPKTCEHPVSGNQVCGVCGGDDLDHGYGFAGGQGLGMYQFCNECYAFLDFVEDRE